MKEIITASSLSMQYENGVEALDKINLSVKENEFISIVGPSGCGKSTLLRIIAGLVTHGLNGKVTVSEVNPTTARKKHQQLAFVFQDANLLPWKNVLSNVKLPLELRKCSKEKQFEYSMSILKLVGLENFAMSYPRQLSGGMKMRVSLARALVTQPKIMLLDEPFGALDEITRQRLNEELLGLWQEEKWTTLFVTHNITEAIFLSNRIIVLSERPGKIIGDIRVPFSYPRKEKIRSDINFAKLIVRVGSLLRQTVHE